MTVTTLTYHQFDDCLWIRCASRGCFVNSPALKNLAERYLESGGNTIVVDLEVCPGVDSTFMGTLAGLARKCMAAGGCVQIASPTQRTRDAMESLGLDMLLELDPVDAPWYATLMERRSVLAQDTEAAVEEEHRDMSEIDRTRHVLEAHNTLRSMSKKNDETFGYVCETLEEDLQRHIDQGDDDT
ncbi:MAG: STAS domain-containing protein [Akkermansia sp.]|nr:STAS domain-containing protein [Akkermansia sp.]